MELTVEERREVNNSQVKMGGRYVFGESKYEVTKRLDIPCKINNYRFYVQTEVARVNISWLISFPMVTVFNEDDKDESKEEEKKRKRRMMSIINYQKRWEISSRQKKWVEENPQR